MTKHRFEELEKRCQKLKKAKITKMILFFAVVSFLVFIFFYLSYQSDKEPVITMKPSIKTDFRSKEEITKESEVISNIESKSYDTLILSPSINEASLELTTDEKNSKIIIKDTK